MVLPMAPASHFTFQPSLDTEILWDAQSLHRLPWLPCGSTQGRNVCCPPHCLTSPSPVPQTRRTRGTSTCISRLFLPPRPSQRTEGGQEGKAPAPQGQVAENMPGALKVLSPGGTHRKQLAPGLGLWPRDPAFLATGDSEFHDQSPGSKGKASPHTLNRKGEQVCSPKEGLGNMCVHACVYVCTYEVRRGNVYVKVCMRK